MKFFPLAQRDEAWLAKRRGMPTASHFHRIITAQGRPSSQAPLYQAELVAERIFEMPVGRDISNLPAIRWGVEREPEAVSYLQEWLGVELQPGGFCLEDRGRYGCSPDARIEIGNRREACEIKCPYEVPVHVRNLLFGPSDDYKAQVQGQLLITGYDAVHFFSYHPWCPPKHVRIERDETFIRKLEDILEAFCNELEVNHKRALEMGAWRRPE